VLTAHVTLDERDSCNSIADLLRCAATMGAQDFELPAQLEALLQEVCAEHGVPARRHDDIRALVESPSDTWPACCGASCSPCVEDSKSTARVILARWSQIMLMK
jgi:hypothetical protein